MLWDEKSHKKVTHSTVEEMSARTFIKRDDIVNTLQVLTARADSTGRLNRPPVAESCSACRSR